MQKIRYVGLDVHSRTIDVAVAEGSRMPAVVGRVANDTIALLKMLDRLGPRERLRVCYEAGPSGYGLARQLNAVGISCVVIAPSLVPDEPGRRIKTDRRDAVRLARFLRSGDLVAVAIPAMETEALRDLVRAREDAVRALLAARQQLDTFLLRHGRRFDGGSKWTHRHWEWIQRQSFSIAAQQHVFDDARSAIEIAKERVDRLTGYVEEQAPKSDLWPKMVALQALRGISLLTATTLAVEIGDFHRFPSAPQFTAYLGLVPSENSSGERRRLGSITRAGNGHVRRVLVEAAWSYRFRARLSKDIAERNRHVSKEVQVIAWKAQQRLSKKFHRLVNRGGFICRHPSFLHGTMVA